MPDQYVGVMQADTSRKASDAVWKMCPFLELMTGFHSGLAYYEDFTTVTAATTNGALSAYKILGTSGVGALLATVDGGVFELQPGTGGANSEAYAAYGQTTGGMGEILNATGNLIWFETRFRVANIVDGGYFLGLAKPGDVASGFLVNSTTVVASTAHAVGLNVANGTPTAGDIVYANAAAPTKYVAAAVTLAANAWHKFGMRYEGNVGGGMNKIRFFLDGVEVANTAGTLGVAATATNFPSSVFLTPTFCAKTTDSTSNNLDIDWVRYAQLIDDSTYG